MRAPIRLARRKLQVLKLPPLVSKVSLCDAGGISESTFERLARRGMGPKPFRIQGDLFYTLEAIEEWEREQRKQRPCRRPRQRQTR